MEIGEMILASAELLIEKLIVVSGLAIFATLSWLALRRVRNPFVKVFFFYCCMLAATLALGLQLLF